MQLRAHQSNCAVDIRIATRPECLDEQAARLDKIFSPMLSRNRETVWQAREQLYAEPGTTILKVSLLPGGTCALISELREWAAAEQMGIDIVAQAYGLMTVALSAHDRTPAFIDRLRARLANSGGSVTVQQIPDAIRGSIDVWDCNSNALPLMREIKRRFDPNRISTPAALQETSDLYGAQHRTGRELIPPASTRTTRPPRTTSISACTAASACPPAPHTCSGARRWTRRADAFT